MPKSEFSIDTNTLIYHTKGSEHSINFIKDLIKHQIFSISIITKIEFLGWKKHTLKGFEKCKNLIETAKIYDLNERIADKAIELKKEDNIKLADSVIAATALLHGLKLATRNVDDFKLVNGLEIINPFN